MTDQPTPTPRTDAQCYGDGRHPYVPTEFARELERELDFSEKSGRQIWDANERLQAELVAERALADRLGSVLDEIAGAFNENGWVLRPAITEALAAWKEARNA